MKKHRFRVGPAGLEYLKENVERDCQQPLAIVEVNSPHADPATAWKDFLDILFGSVQLDGPKISVDYEVDSR